MSAATSSRRCLKCGSPTEPWRHGQHETLIHWPSAHRKGVDLAETVAYLRGHGLSDNEAHALAQTPDGPRYRAIGNSWPVPVAAWLGRRIQEHLACPTLT